jgi:riboflavin kinase / FMN adenylyltransferase
MTAELPCRLTGRVVHGDHRGRTIGFPTANLHIVAPASDLAVGVYAGTVAEQPAMISVGVRPTFEEEGEKRVEVHLLDFSGDLYDREITVVVRAWLRAERRFAGVRELIEQLEMDAAAARLAMTEPYLDPCATR